MLVLSTCVLVWGCTPCASVVNHVLYMCMLYNVSQVIRSGHMWLLQISHQSGHTVTVTNKSSEWTHVAVTNKSSEWTHGGCYK